ILSSTDFGSTWETIFSTEGLNTTLSSIEMVNDSVGFIATYAGSVLKTTDGGSTWEKTTVGLPTLSYHTVKFFNENDGVIGSLNGLYYSTSDGGSTWTLEGSSGSTTIYAM